MCAAMSVGALRDAMLEGLLPYGFLGFTFAAIRKVKSVYLHSDFIATWPRGLQTTFQQHALFNADPVIVRSRNTPEAFAWDLSLHDQDDPVHAQILFMPRSWPFACPWVSQVASACRSPKHSKGAACSISADAASARRPRRSWRSNFSQSTSPPAPGPSADTMSAAESRPRSNAIRASYRPASARLSDGSPSANPAARWQ